MIPNQLLRKLLFSLCGLCLYSISIAQTIKGKVTDENNVPLSGVTVQVNKSATGTSTDSKGEFSIAAPHGATLVFSYIGYTSIEKKVNGPTLIVRLEKGTGNVLSDVVIVGYGTQKKVDLTGAVSTVSSKMLENRPVTNAIAALQGTVPGLTVTRTNGEPGKEGYSIQIRGLTSVNGSNPLVVIDGVPGGSLSLLNPNDIASISVLKDASAAAIYGASAAGGVILVTTKNGKKGKLTVQYSGIYSVNKPINIPKLIPSWQQAEMLNEAETNANISPAWTEQQIAWMKSTNPADKYQINPTNPHKYDYYYNFNELDYVTRKYTSSQNHNVSASGGNDKSQYLFSFGYFGQNGIFNVGPDKTDRYNGRFNYNTKLNSFLSIDSKLSYTKTNTLSPSYGANGDYGILYNLYQLRTLYPIFVPGTNNTKYAYGSGINPYATLKDGGSDNSVLNGIDGIFTLKADSLIKNLTLRVIYSPHLLFSNEVVENRTVTLWNDPTSIGSLVNSPNSLSKSRYQQSDNSLQALADYDWNLGEKNHFHVLGGYSFESYRYDYESATAKNLSSNDLFSLNLGDPKQASNSDNIQTWSLLSYFGRLNYDFDNRILFEASMRDDGSSRLDPLNRWRLFPAFSLGWRMENEKWFHNILGIFNQFKPRISWGKLGNANFSNNNLNNYDYLSLISSAGAPPFNNQINNSFYDAVLGSPKKTWETIETSDIGLDIALLNGRLFASGDYYIKNNLNMLAPLQISSIIGISTSSYNIASMKTKGWGFNVGWKDKISDFRYWINFNMSDNQNTITNYGGKNIVASGLNTIIQGQPYNSIYGYVAQGFFSTQDQVSKHAFQSNITGPGDIIYKDLNGDGKINAGNGTLANHGDLAYLGNTSPRYLYGFDLGFSWKNFDLSAFFQGVGKRSMFIYSYANLPFVDSWRQPWQNQTDYWTPTHTNAKFPRLYLHGGQNTSVSSFWVQNAAYLRLKNLQIGYTLPSRITQKAGMRAVRIYFTGQDIWTISKMWFKYYDPESPNNADFIYPYFSSFAAGLNVTF